MSLLYTKNRSSKLLTKKLSISNTLSPKSVTTYVRELREDNTWNIQNISNSKVGDENPTDLHNVLNALKASSKRNLSFSHAESNDAADNEICDFKNIGDVSIISFTGENSFVEISSEDENDETDAVPDVKSTKEEKSYTRLDEERSEDDSGDEGLGVFNCLKMDILMSQMQLEKDRLNQSQTNFNKLKNSYIQNLMQIRKNSHDNLLKVRLEEQQNEIVEQKRLQDLEELANQEILLVEKEYIAEVERKKAEILKEVEVVMLEEEKKSLHFKSRIDGVSKALDRLQGSIILVQSEARNIDQSSELFKILFEELPTIYETTRNTVSKMSSQSSTEADIDIVTRRIADALHILENIQRLVEGYNAQGSPSKEKNSEPSESAVPRPNESEPLFQPATNTLPFEGDESATRLSPPPPYIPKETSSTKESSPAFDDAERFYRILKSKFNEVSEEANVVRENAHLRPLLSRAVGIVNTFNNEKFDSSNKGKLQQILNLLSGRSCTVGSDNISTANNPSAQAFVKEQLATRIVSLSHDKQVATMGIYASLIVRLWQLNPEVGELMLFKLYETCPFLVPVSIRRDPTQTDEEFNRSLGIRHKEGSAQEPVDKYLTRMGAAAQLYGRIVSMQIDNHPHGIHEGWKWIARTLSLPPQPSITAALLYGFLSTAGASLLGHYGKQFRKLLHYIYDKYLPNIERDILEGGHSDIVGLKTILDHYQRTNAMPQVPEGYKLLL